jgi:alkanesulfonate monooxygenase SsuD/methylene tetrahydromethanopterin reductase-like flavin-dependent oxidoreductase (luciferase family)
MKPLVAAARTEQELAAKVRDARARIAFYASTPGYAAAFEHVGLRDLAAEAKELSKRQQWEELPRLVSDEVVERFAVIGTYDEIGEKLLDRFGSVVTDIEFSIAVTGEEDRETLAELARTIQAHDDAAVRASIRDGAQLGTTRQSAWERFSGEE